jgi:hypothetical protein
MPRYAFITEEDAAASAVPARLVNGGLYTGEAAQGSWGNVPVAPEPHILAENLLSAKPPPHAHKMAMTNERPGNNHVELPYYTGYGETNPQLRCLK